MCQMKVAGRIPLALIYECSQAQRSQAREDFLSRSQGLPTAGKVIDRRS